ncbi:MAG TPA: hypothetical protein EYP62_03600, partial [Kiritimatiellae bacterium]|nr:hypothetical protein [Kiritimatiellia bacterium]
FWGRSGCRTRRLVFRADDVETALAYLRSVVRKRKRRDYRVSHVDDDHPLAEWLADIQIPVEELPDTQMDLFSDHTGAVDHIFLRMFDGSQWVELGDSAHGNGLSGNDAYPATGAVVRVAGDGNPVVAWLQGTASGWTIYLAKWDGAAWTELGGSLSAGVPGAVMPVEPPVMAIDGAGNPVLAWVEVSGVTVVRVRRWTGSSWQDLGDHGYSPGVRSPSLAVGGGGQIYLAWAQYPFGGNPLMQVFLERYSGGGWSAVGGSTTYPGVSAATNAAMQPAVVAVAAASTSAVAVAWCCETNDAVLVRKWDGSSWQGLADSDVLPGVAPVGGVSAGIAAEMGAAGLPVVAFGNIPVQTNLEQVLLYAFVGDSEPPVFAGLGSASGGTNGNVVLEWDPGSDCSTTIYYHVFMSTQWWVCGSSVTCSPAEVFTNQIAVLTNVTQYEVTGLTPNRAYCFGVRASDTNGLMDGNTVTKSAGPITGTGDNDGDCLDNARELAAGTEPCLADTDGDGMWDGWEWSFSTNNPAHTNAVALDPLDNGTDRVDTPQAEDGDPGQAPDADPDGDGASNLEEFQWWYQNIYLAGGGVCEAGSPTNRISPDPTQADTDADGIPDMWEMVNGLDPTDPSDAGVDSDGDGLSDGEEYRWSSDPYNPDTDGDGIPDGTEVSLGLYPAQADSDQDGLDDGFEQSIGTDPADADTTDRGLSDGDAYELGWDPASCTSVWRVLLWENFETAPSANWSSHYVNPYVPFNLWHLSQAEPDPKTNQIRYLYDRSTNTAYRVADDAPGGTNVLADYDIGSAILCALDSPLIDASAAETLFLSWNEYYETEPGNDVVEVLVRGGTDVNWVVVSPPVSGKSGASGPSQPARWVHRVVDISSFAGMSNVQVRFLFNAQNAINNEYAGWYVDDVAVFEGVTMSGWVRDVYGQPLVGAVVRALGGGLITNVVDGDRLGGLGRIFGETSTAADGSYRLTGLPQGRYYLKAEAPSYRAEFYDGALFAGGYGFGHELHPGVPFRDQVTAGTVVLTNYGGAAECHFELERGLGRAALAALWPAAEPVMVDGVVQEVWNGLTNAPAMTPYRTTNALPGGYNHPDWLTNQVVPSAAHDLGPGEHLVRIGTNDFGSLVKVTVRDGELAVVSAGTNKAAGKLYVAADDGGGYPVWIDYLETTNLTPCYVTLPQGLHLVWLYSSGMSFRPPVQQVEIRPASLTDAVFTNLAGSQSCGALRIVAEDIWGGVLTGATVLINGVAVGPADVAAGCSNTTPTIVTNLLPGQHVVTLLKDGYRQPPATFVQVAPHVTNVLAITLYDSDRDCDQVPDSSEVLSYTNIFLYHRADDPDGDGLSNLMEADQYVYHRVRMNLFAADSDGDALSDEAELGLDGAPDYLAMSCLATNVEEGTDTVPALFRGRFLEGINFFGATGVVAVECDAFMPSHHTCQVPALPSADGVLLRFEGIPSAGDDQAITVSHVAGAVVEADTRPDEVDTDG